MADWEKATRDIKAIQQDMQKALGSWKVSIPGLKLPGASLDRMNLPSESLEWLNRPIPPIQPRKDPEDAEARQLLIESLQRMEMLLLDIRAAVERFDD